MKNNRACQPLLFVAESSNSDMGHYLGEEQQCVLTTVTIEEAHVLVEESIRILAISSHTSLPVQRYRFQELVEGLGEVCGI